MLERKILRLFNKIAVVPRLALEKDLFRIREEKEVLVDAVDDLHRDGKDERCGGVEDLLVFGGELQKCLVVSLFKSWEKGEGETHLDESPVEFDAIHHIFEEEGAVDGLNLGKESVVGHDEEKAAGGGKQRGARREQEARESQQARLSSRLRRHSLSTPVPPQGERKASGHLRRGEKEEGGDVHSPTAAVCTRSRRRGKRSLFCCRSALQRGERARSRARRLAGRERDFEVDNNRSRPLSPSARAPRE